MKEQSISSLVTWASVTRAVTATCLVAAAGCSEPVSLTVQATGTGTAALMDAQIEVLGEGLTASLGTSNDVTLNSLRFTGWKGIKITATGYQTTYRQVDFVAGQSYTLSVALVPAPSAHHVTLPDPSSTAPLAVQEGITTVTLTPGGLVHKDGSTVTGDVDVLIIPYDPESMLEPPATLRTTDGKNLISLGMSTITITQNGEELQPKPGVPLGWDMDVNPLIMPISDPGKYTLWSVDENVGAWQAEPTATVVYDATANHFSAKLPHLSVWNLDFAWLDGSCITGQVFDAHHNAVAQGSVSAVDVSVGESTDAQLGVLPNAAYQYTSVLGVPSPQYLGGNVYGGCGQGGGCPTRPVSIPSNGFFIPVPALDPAFYGYAQLKGIYGLTELPMQITLNGGPAGQSLYKVTLNGTQVGTNATQGPLTPPSYSCDTVNFQFCLADGNTCSSGDVCCDGNACGSDGKCGGAQCGNTGATCSSSSDCCSGQVCTNGVCGPVPTCAAPGNHCNSITDCCASSKFCANNTCVACLPTNATGCGSTADCCSGSCVGGVCLDCQDNGASCSSTGQCCDGRFCVAPAAGQSSSGEDYTCQACIPPGHGACTADSQCCDGSECKSGVCTACSNLGGSCGSTADCCSGFCLDGSSCASCVPLEHACVSGEPCCGGGTCAFDNKCRVCSAAGAACSTGIDCCSGSCSDNVCM